MRTIEKLVPDVTAYLLYAVDMLRMAEERPESEALCLSALVLASHIPDWAKRESEAAAKGPYHDALRQLANRVKHAGEGNTDHVSQFEQGGFGSGPYGAGNFGASPIMMTARRDDDAPEEERRCVDVLAEVISWWANRLNVDIPPDPRKLRGMEENV